MFEGGHRQVTPRFDPADMRGSSDGKDSRLTSDIRWQRTKLEFPQTAISAPELTICEAQGLKWREKQRRNQKP